LRDNIKYFNIEPVDIVTQDHFYSTSQDNFYSTSQDNFYSASSNEVDNNIIDQFRNAAFIPQDHDRNHDQSNYDNIIGIKQKDIEVHNTNENIDLIEIYNTVCDMNRNKYQIDSIVNIIGDWKFENNSVYEDSEQTIQTQNKYCSKHCYNVNEAKKLDFQLAQQLAQWALRKNIKFNALSDLLTILRKNNHQFLPQCAKTVLKTPRNTTSLIKNFKADGEF